MSGSSLLSGEERIRHRALRRIARAAYAIPGVGPAARALARFSIQDLPLSLKNRQRLYNFFSKEPALQKWVNCRVPMSKGKSIRLKLDLKEQMASDWYYWGYTGYETGTARLLAHLFEKNRCFFDVGANIGYYTLMACCLMGRDGQVHAFEPLPEAFRTLSENTARRSLPGLSLNQMALSDIDGEAPLFLHHFPSQLNASLLREISDSKECISVKTIRFDTYCEKNRIDRVDLIKLDVEGAELKVLQGMGPLLERDWPDLVLEVLLPFEEALNRFFQNRPYRKFLIRDEGLEETGKLKAHPHLRNFYLSCSPVRKAVRRVRAQGETLGKT